MRRFFDEVLVAGLLMPDGWFGGRAMEGHHRLTLVVSRPKRLLVELDEHLLLSFSGTPRIERTSSDLALADGTPALVIRDYRQCVLEFLEYANQAPHVAAYTEGQVCLVAPS